MRIVAPIVTGDAMSSEMRMPSANGCELASRRRVRRAGDEKTRRGQQQTGEIDDRDDLRRRCDSAMAAAATTGSCWTATVSRRRRLG